MFKALFPALPSTCLDAAPASRSTNTRFRGTGAGLSGQQQSASGHMRPRPTCRPPPAGRAAEAYRCNGVSCVACPFSLTPPTSTSCIYTITQWRSSSIRRVQTEPGASSRSKGASQVSNAVYTSSTQQGAKVMAVPNGSAGKELKITKWQPHPPAPHSPSHGAGIAAEAASGQVKPLQGHPSRWLPGTAAPLPAGPQRPHRRRASAAAPPRRQAQPPPCRKRFPCTAARGSGGSSWQRSVAGGLITARGGGGRARCAHPPAQHPPAAPTCWAPASAPG